MAHKRHVSFAASAVEDLEAIRAWYAEQQIPEVGERLLREVIAQVERLADFPESGRLAPELEGRGVRDLVHSAYRVFYRADEATVLILTVRHGSQLIREDEVAEGRS